MTREVGVLIATYGRPSELSQMLASLANQTLRLRHVVVVDATSGSKATENREVCESADLNVQYVHSSVPSSTIQRNIGVAILRELSVDYIQVLDDDTLPEPDYIERLLAVLEAKPGSVGASGITGGNATAKGFGAKISKFVYSLVGLESFKPGSVSLAGCGIPVREGSKTVEATDWLFGCSLWRASVFDVLEYNPLLRGAALAEDLDFSVLARKLGSLWVDPEAILNHLSSPLERPNEELFAYRFARNRWFVVCHMPRPILAKCYYVVSNLFLAATWLLKGLLLLDGQKISASRSTIRGMIDAWRKIQPI